jgi:hypothetical protein
VTAARRGDRRAERGCEDGRGVYLAVEHVIQPGRRATGRPGGGWHPAERGGPGEGCGARDHVPASHVVTVQW